MEAPPATSFKESSLDVLCGSVAGAAGKLLEYPFDTVKVRLQSQPDHLPPKFSGPLDCFRQTLQREGFAGLYRGIAGPIVGAAAENASLFVSYGIAQSLFRKVAYGNVDRLPDHILLLCGAISGITTSFVLTPIELVKCQMQVQSLYSTQHQHHQAATGSLGAAAKAGKVPRIASHGLHTIAPLPGPIQLVSAIYRKDGLAGLWRGQTGTLFREAGGSAAWFGSYEYVNKTLRTYRGDANGKNTITENMLAGAVAGVMFNLSLFPADTIKSRIQTESVVAAHHGTAAVQKGFFEVGKHIYTTGGLQALYRGCGITIARAAPSSAIIFVTYEKLKEFSKGLLG